MFADLLVKKKEGQAGATRILRTKGGTEVFREFPEDNHGDTYVRAFPDGREEHIGAGEQWLLELERYNDVQKNLDVGAYQEEVRVNLWQLPGLWWCVRKCEKAAKAA